jgi:hypothetical protein
MYMETVLKRRGHDVHGQPRGRGHCLREFFFYFVCPSRGLYFDMDDGLLRKGPEIMHSQASATRSIQSHATLMDYTIWIPVVNEE